MHNHTRSQNIPLTPNVLTPDVNVNELGAGIPEASAASTRIGAPRAQVPCSPPNNQLPITMVSADNSKQAVTPVSMHLQGARIGGRTRLTNVKGDYVPTTVNNFGETNDLRVLENFVSFEAQFDSSVQDTSRQCHPGTRENVLKRLRDWIDNPNSTDRIFWLYGPAGAGKSAIAQTIARAYTRPKVAATFFFFRSDVKRNDGDRLFTTLAYQLAFAIPAIRDHIAYSLSKRPDLPKTDVETQFKQLLARPFHMLNDDGIEQLAPVIIIDGVDECVNEDLQRQFLKVIGDAIGGDCRFPLRFLVVSRPELHIEQAIHRFQAPVLTINLADLDDANRDIKKYLVDEFSRIASEQSLDSTWPGQDIINNIVYKSSGNFIFASVVIRFVGDPYCFAKAQLDIVMNIKMPKMMTPFAVLDQLFLEILRRVPDQDFLERYLVLLVARISVSSEYRDLHKDDAVLMHVSEQELHANLRRMRSILRFEHGIDVHHKSFVDFLRDSSRSGEYYIPSQDGIKGYLEVFVDSFVRYVSLTMEQPPCHAGVHFTPTFRNIVKHYPPTIRLPTEDWCEVIQPVVDLQDRLLQWQNSSSTWGLLRCNECTTFYLLREFMHLRIYLGVNSDAPSVGKVEKLGKFERFSLPITAKVKKPKNDNDLDAILLSLFAHLPETMENRSPNKTMIDCISVVLRFDCAEAATKVRSVSDAQKLVDFLDYMIHAKDLLPVNARGKASLLAFKIHERVPIIPRSYFLNKCVPSYNQWTPDEMLIDSEILSQTIFASRMIDCCYMPLLYRPDRGLQWKDIYFMVESQSFPISQWLQQLSSRSVPTIQVMLSLARAIQYLHSMGIVLDSRLDLDDVFLDTDIHSQIRHLCSISQSVLNEDISERFSRKENLFSFGCLFYQMYSDIDPRPDSLINSGQHVILQRSTRRHIPEYAWQLIQRCCADDPKSRPSMDEIVQEMEIWPMEETESPFSLEHIEQSRRDRSFFRGLYSVFLRLGRNKRAPLS